MRKVFVFTISLIVLISCVKNDEPIKIIKPVKGEYRFVNFWSTFGEEKTESIDSLLTDIKNFLVKNNFRSERPLFFDYELFINSKGKLDKIVVLESSYPQVDEYVAKYATKWEFKPLLEHRPIPTRTKLRFRYFKIGDEIEVSIQKGYRFVTLTKNGLSLNKTYFIAVEEMPEPIGGLEAIQKKIIYPEIAKRAGIEGRVFVKAYIDENGNVVETEVIKGIGAGCDEAAMKAVKETKFKPGRQRGKPVKVQVSIPILFKLKGSNIQQISK